MKNMDLGKIEKIIKSGREEIETGGVIYKR